MKARGMAMVEALVASALLAIGLLGATRLSTYALHAALQTRQDMQAHQLAMEALDCAVARLPTCPANTERVLQGSRYRLALSRSPLDTALDNVQVQVQWTGADGRAQSLQRQTRVSGLPDWLGLSSP